MLLIAGCARAHWAAALLRCQTGLPGTSGTAPAGPAVALQPTPVWWRTYIEPLSPPPATSPRKTHEARIQRPDPAPAGPARRGADHVARRAGLARHHQRHALGPVQPD